MLYTKISLLPVFLFLFPQIFCFNNINISQKYTLITCLYSEKNPLRKQEYLTCLHKNINNTLIEQIHIIYDTSESSGSDSFLVKLKELEEEYSSLMKISFSEKRQQYGDTFNIANLLYPDKKIIVSNADIFFDDSLSLLSDIEINNKVYTLTRWELNKENKPYLMKDPSGFPAVYSQDVWIFKSPIAFFPGYNITMGVMGCDHKISYQLIKAGFDVFNPCLEVKSYHLHQSGIRNCKQRNIPYAYSAYIPWCRIKNIKQPASKIWATK